MANDATYMAMLRARVAYEKASLAKTEFDLKQEELRAAEDKAHKAYQKALDAWCAETAREREAYLAARPELAEAV